MTEYYSVVGQPSATNSSRWLTEEVYELIDTVKNNEAIYNPRHKYYFCRPYVENFWRGMDKKLDKNSGASLSKWTNLRISFRREYTNYLTENVPPCWSYFDRMFFLHSYLRKKHSQNKSAKSSEGQSSITQINTNANRVRKGRRRLGKHSISDSADNYLEYDDEVQTISESDDDQIKNILQSACVQQLQEQSTPIVQKIHDEDSISINEVKSEDEDFDVKIIEKCNENVSEDDVDFIEETDYLSDQSHSSKKPEKKKSFKLNMNNTTIKRQQYKREDDAVVKRSKSLESSTIQTQHSAASPSQSNVSFVRPTFTKPMESAISTSNPNLQNNSPSENLNASVVSAQELQTIPPRHRESSSLGGVKEFCECKTDSDAMFLMSLLPDIQKLNGRARGKLKIAFQNTIQDYLYPEYPD